MIMKIIGTKFPKVKIIQFHKKEDNRGVVETSYDCRELSNYEIEFQCKEQRIYSMEKRGTFFGIHFQTNEYPQDKIVRVISGSGIDYIVDLNKESPTYKQWISINLCEGDNNSVYIPQGYGHAFLSLEDNTVQLFTISEHFYQGYSKQIRFDDAEIGLLFPIEIEELSDYDKNAPLLSEI